MSETGVGYTIATGRLYCSMEELQGTSEVLLGRPVMTHEFALRETWDELRSRLEETLTEDFQHA